MYSGPDRGYFGYSGPFYIRVIALLAKKAKYGLGVGLVTTTIVL